MQLTISGHHLDITKPLKNYVTEKLVRIERHFDHVSNTNVVLQVEKTRHLAEATVAAKGTTIHANAEADDMYAAIDALVSKLDSQVRRLKGKQTNYHRNGGTIKTQKLK